MYKCVYWQYVMSYNTTNCFHAVLPEMFVMQTRKCLHKMCFHCVGRNSPTIGNRHDRICNKLTLAVSLAQPWEDHLSLDKSSRDNERQPVLPASHTPCPCDNNRVSVTLLDAESVCPTLCSNSPPCTADMALPLALSC